MLDGFVDEAGCNGVGCGGECGCRDQRQREQRGDKNLHWVLTNALTIVNKWLTPRQVSTVGWVVSPIINQPMPKCVDEELPAGPGVGRQSQTGGGLAVVVGASGGVTDFCDNSDSLSFIQSLSILPDRQA